MLVLPPGDDPAARRFAPSWGVSDRRRGVFSRSSRRLLGSRETTHNKAVERTAAPLGRDEVAGDWTLPGFGERRGRAAVAHLGRYAKRHACSVAVRSRAVRAFDHLRTRLERAAGFVCFASGRSPSAAEFGVSGQSWCIAEHFFRRSLLDLLGPRIESHNKALDRTAMSAVFGVFADSWVPAALTAVGQLGRYAKQA